jgi:hypothetical protein
MTRNFDGLYKITAALAGTAWIVLFALLLTIPLMAMHLYARAYIEPTIESSDDCKDPNARPGSRAESPPAFEPAESSPWIVGSIIAHTSTPPTRPIAAIFRRAAQQTQFQRSIS